MSKRLLLVSAVVFAVVNCGVGTRCFAEDASEQLERADDFRDTRKYEEAEAIYKGIAEEYAGTDYGLRAQRKLVCLYIERGRTAEAEAAYQELLTGYGDHDGIAEAVDDVADAYRDVKEYEKALELHSYVADTWGDSAKAIDAQAGIARVNIALGREEAAQAAIEKLIADFSETEDIADTVDEVADEWRDAKKYDKALELYKYVVNTWPGSDQAMGSQADVAKSYIELGDDPNTKAAVDKLIADFAGLDEIADAVDDVANEWGDAKKYDKAVELYKYVVNRWPDSEQAMGSQAEVAKSYIELGDDPNAVAYAPVSKPPGGFWLRKASLVEVIPEGMFASVWRKEAGRNKLGTPVVEKLRTRKGTKYGNTIEEHWKRGRDRLDFRKLICPDKETLDATVDLMLHSYAEVHVETQEPLVGERTWISKKPERHVVSLFASEGLILVRVHISCASMGIEDIESLTKDIATKGLREPWSVQEAQLKERIEAHINRVRQLHKFDTWRGKTKIADKQVDSLSSIDEGFFKTFSSKLEILTPKRERDRVLSVRLLEVSSGTAVYVEIEAADNPLAAHERMTRDVALASAPSNFKISEPNDPNNPLNIGDICCGFVPGGVRVEKGIPIPRELFFCRNNVFVHLRSPAGTPVKKYPDLRPIALLVDKKLELEMLSNPK